MGSTAAVDAGKSFRDALGQVGNEALNGIIPERALMQAATPAVRAVAPTIQDFLSGATSGFVPMSNAPSSSVTVALPNATPVKTVAPAVAAPVAAVAARPAVVDPTAGLSGLSFRQLLTLAQTGQAENRGTPRPVTTADQAGQQLSAMYSKNFQDDLKNAGNDSAKQQAAFGAFEKKMLPLALKGNTADAAIFDGSTPGAQ